MKTNKISIEGRLLRWLGLATSGLVLLAAPLDTAAQGIFSLGQPPAGFYQNSFDENAESESGDLFGRALVVGDFNADGFGDAVIGSPSEDAGSTANCGMIQVVYGAPGGLNANPYLAPATHFQTGSVEGEDQFGKVLASGDFNGDGYDDVAIGVPNEDVEGDDAGGVGILYGGAQGLQSSFVGWSQETWNTGANEAHDRFGTALAIGDFNGDGYDDILAGTDGEDIGSTGNVGGASVLWGSAAGTTQTPQNMHYGSFRPITANRYWGRAVAAGDFNGDGFDDAAVAGVDGVQIIFGSAAGMIVGQGAGHWLDFNTFGTGTAGTDDFTQVRLATADFDQDGFDDLVIGTPYRDARTLADSGEVNVIFGSALGFSPGYALPVYREQGFDQGQATREGDPVEAGDNFGFAVATGDFDSNGYPDLAVGARWEDRDLESNAGHLTVVFGSGAGLGEGLSPVYTDFGSMAGNEFAWCLATGDINGDGFSDLLVGCPYYDLWDTIDAGVVALLYGYAPVTATPMGAGLPGVVYAAVAWGDYDGDTDLDLLLTGEGDAGYVAGIFTSEAGTFTDLGADLYGVAHGSVAWGDYGNDGDLDLLIAGRTSDSPAAGPMALIYENRGGTFVRLATRLPRVADGCVNWVDYDGDGDLDIFVAGRSGPDLVARLYRNDDGALTDAGAGLAGVEKCAAAWGDYDGDGDLDLLLCGLAGMDPVTTLYRNDGGEFVDAGAALPDLFLGSADWGDHDADGDLDLLLTGVTGAGSRRLTQLYENTGGTFTLLPQRFPGLARGSATWGDVDNDGDIDILLAGETLVSSLYRDVTLVYFNEGGGNFAVQAMPGLPSAEYGTATWGDWDGDDSLDILITGRSGTGRMAEIYRLDGEVRSNAPPATPTPASGAFVADRLVLRWNPPADDATPAMALSYNVRVGTTPGGGEICSGAAASGPGRITTGTQWSVRVPSGVDNVYWSVQAVDGAFARSDFGAVTKSVRGHESQAPSPRRVALHQNAPNPFNPRTKIAFDLPGPRTVSLRVYDLAGRAVRTLLDAEPHGPGTHEEHWNGDDEAGRRVAAGTYIYRLDVDGTIETRRMVLIK